MSCVGLFVERSRSPSGPAVTAIVHSVVTRQHVETGHVGTWFESTGSSLEPAARLCQSMLRALLNGYWLRNDSSCFYHDATCVSARPSA